MCREEICHQGEVCPQVYRGKVRRVVRAGEKVKDCLWGWGVRTGGAVRGGRGINGMEVALEFGAITGAELGEGSSVVSG